MYQAAMKVNVLSPVILGIVGAEVFHFIRKQHVCNHFGKVVPSYGGLSGMVQDGVCVNLGDPTISFRWMV